MVVLLLTRTVLAVPVATDDRYNAAEDVVLNTLTGPIISADFDNNLGGVVAVFDGDWDYLDRMENQLGADHDYPVDGAGLAWNSPGFEVASSTVGPWGSAPLPLQGGTVEVFPADTPNLLEGIGEGPNGENIITTYLFRNTFTLTAEEAVVRDWIARLAVDDGCVIFINGTEVGSIYMPDGAIDSNTLAEGGDESVYNDVELNVAGLLIAGVNTIAIEVHQGSLGSSDAGLDISLQGGGGISGGFVFVDDPFGTSQPDYAAGVVDETGGFSGAGLHITIGGLDNRFVPEPHSTSGAFTQSFTLAAAATLEVSLRYRLVNSNPFEQFEFGEAILEVNGVRYGNDENESLVHINGGGDSGWQSASFNLPLQAGNHTITLGAYTGGTSRPNEEINVYFDDILVTQGAEDIGGVLGNDEVGENATVAVLTQPSHGVLNMAPDGIFLYTPQPDYFGLDSFTYEVTDETGTSGAATVVIDVQPVNDAPEGVADTYSVVEDEVFTVAVPGDGVLVNDRDLEGDTLSAIEVQDVENGLLSLNPDGTFTYTPNDNYFGTDTFSYRVGDGSLESEPVSVTLIVQPQPDDPVTEDDAYVARENEVLSITVASGGLGGASDLVSYGAEWRYNDTGTDLGVAWRDPGYDDSQWDSGPSELGYGDGDEAQQVGFGGDSDDKHPTTYFRRTFLVEQASSIIEARCRVFRDDGIVVYLNGTRIGNDNIGPDPQYGDFAQNAFDDGNQEIELPAVPVQLFQEGENTLAVEIHQSDERSSDISFNLQLEVVREVVNGLLANDVDLDQTGLTAVLESGPANGVVVVNDNGTFSYTPGLNFEGPDSFVYRAINQSGSSLGSVSIEVRAGLNDIPETQPDAYAPDEDRQFDRGAGEGVLANDEDPDGDLMTAILVDAPLNGELTLEEDGAFSYQPVPDFFGTDRFTYVVSDGQWVSPVETVTLNVKNSPDAPVSVENAYATDPGTWIIVSEQDGILSNDFDPDGTGLSVELVDNVQSGELTISPGGSFFYLPADGAAGAVTFSYRASDGVLTSPVTTVTIYLDSAPQAVMDNYRVQEDRTKTVSAAEGVLHNDSDRENDPLSAVLLSPTEHGSLSFTQDGAFTYTPDQDFSGQDSFTYLAMSGIRSSTPATVNLLVQGSNDPPVAVADAYLAIRDLDLEVSSDFGVLANDIDVDSLVLEALVVTPPVHGELDLNLDGSFTYTHPPGFEGVDSFTYLVRDEALSSSPARVSIQIGGASDVIVINEIMYHPASEDSSEEYLELVNIGDGPVQLKDWRFTSGVSYTFPELSIPAGGFLVVAADPAKFTDTYGEVSLLTGGWTGSLSNRGERIRLADQNGEQVDEVRYYDQGDWATRTRVTDTGEPGWVWAAAHDGAGESLELVQAALTNKSGQNWQASVGGPTPGLGNSAALPESAFAPLIQDVQHTPAVPRSTDTVTVQARLRDTDATSLSATLHYRVSVLDPSEFLTVPLLDDGLHDDGEANDGLFAANLPAMEDQTVIEFYISATDGVNERSWPAPTSIGQVANLHFQVDDQVNPEGEGVYRLVMTRAENRAFTRIDRDSNAQHNCTLIADDCSGPVVRYQCGVRVRGASSRRDNPPPMRINIPRSRSWNGITQMNLNTQFTWLQFIGMKLFQASDLPAPDTSRISVWRNGNELAGGDEEDYGSLVYVQPPNFEFVDHKMPGDSQGNLYKKVRPDVNWAYREGDYDRYVRDGWGKQTNESEDDWTDLDEFLRVLNQADSDTDYIDQVEKVANLDQWMRWFAVETLIANGETNASNGTDDDYSMYRGVSDPRFIFLPHDLDTILGRGDGSRITDPEHTLFDMIESGPTLGPLIPLFNDPGIRTRYFQELRKLTRGSFSKVRFDALLLNHLSGWVPGAVIEGMIEFMDDRRAYIEAVLEGELGPALVADVAESFDSLNAPRDDLYLSEVLAVNETAHEVNGKFPDFVELRNAGPTRSLAGYSLTDDLLKPGKFIFPAGASIGDDQRLLLYADSSDGPGIRLGFSLNGAGESVSLFDPDGVLVDSVVFGPQVADLSIGRTGLSEEEWRLNIPTPGTENQIQSLGDPAGLRINEWMSKPETIYTQDFVELYNPDALPVSLGGMSITDSPGDPDRGTILPALSFLGGGGYGVLEAVGNDADSPSELPFKLSASYGWLAIYGSNMVEIDRVHTSCDRPDFSQGRVTDGDELYARFAVPTPGFSNATDLSAEYAILQSLRVTEIMYHPADTGDAEFIELRNVGGETLNLEGVEFTKGVSFAFPAMTLEPGEYVVVVADQEAFRSVYGFGNEVAGEWSGKLDNDDDRLRLEIVALNAVIHDFTYLDGWFPSTDGGGFSLVVIDENASQGSWNEQGSWTAGSTLNGTPGSGSGFFVFAGVDQVVSFPASATLDASVLYGPLDPSTVTLTWILDDGPALATFGNSANEDTTITVPQAGRYTFELIASPEVGPSRSSRVTVTFLDTYPAWVARQFDQPGGPSAERLSDEDRDGLVNILEFALALDPLDPDPGSLLAPFLSEDGFLSMVYFRRFLPEGAKVIPEVSTNLLSWDSGPGAVSETVMSVTDEGEWIEARDLFAHDGVTPRFMRLRVDGFE